MDKTGPNDSWALPQACLRLKFWQMAEGNPAGQAPFEAKRAASLLPRSDISEQMGLTPSDYANFESGAIHAAPRDIVAFCKAVECHPLELYDPEAGPETPLPPEIFDSLVLTIEDPSTPEAYRRRSWNRLELEARRAQAMVREFRQELKPLFQALGFVPADQEKHLPLIMAAGPRRIMDRALIEYGLVLEERFEAVERDFSRNEIQYAHNKRQMNIKAAAMFGDNAPRAIAGLMALLESTIDHGKIKAQIKKKPDMFCPLKDGANCGAGEAGVFFARVRWHRDLLRQNDEIKSALSGAAKKLAGFTSWNDKPQVLTLLDWYEHYSVIKELTSRKNHPRNPRLRGPAGPA